MATSFQNSCTSTSGNLGLSGCGLDSGRWSGLVLGPVGEEIADQDTAETLSTWTTKFQAAYSERSFALKDFERFIMGENEERYETGDEGEVAHLNTLLGTHAFEKLFDSDGVNLIEYEDWQKVLNSGARTAYIITAKGYVLGWTDGTKFLPFDLALLRAELMTAETFEAKSKGVVKFKFKYASQLRTMRAIKTTNFDPNFDFYSLQSTESEYVSGVSATGAVIDVTVKSTGKGVSGLVAADFQLTLASGSTVAVATAEESSTIPGRYTLTWASQAAGSHAAGLKASASMTTQGYDEQTAAVVVIPD